MFFAVDYGCRYTPSWCVGSRVVGRIPYGQDEGRATESLPLSHRDTKGGDSHHAPEGIRVSDSHRAPEGVRVSDRHHAKGVRVSHTIQENVPNYHCSGDRSRRYLRELVCSCYQHYHNVHVTPVWDW